ncbi:MAG TPA: helix-turn-helix transcriptional regulator, partial [Candidatus Sumerlaeota bacterium]|nr:helix-turn-helix transcriptional regulator [Candidatus Sumerlaeota bacterium]
LGQTLKEASREIGISFHTFFKWEHGIRTPHSPLYSKIISYLGYDPWGEADLTFGNLLHLARLRLGLTRTNLSEQLGICRGAYARWENDRITRPCMRERRLLEKFLKQGIPPEDDLTEIQATSKGQNFKKQ